MGTLYQLTYPCYRYSVRVGSSYTKADSETNYNAKKG